MNQYIVGAITALIGYFCIRKCEIYSLGIVLSWIVMSDVLSIIVIKLVPDLFLYAVTGIALSLIVAVVFWINYKIKIRHIARLTREVVFTNAVII